MRIGSGRSLGFFGPLHTKFDPLSEYISDGSPLRIINSRRVARKSSVMRSDTGSVLKHTKTPM